MTALDSFQIPEDLKHELWESLFSGETIKMLRQSSFEEAASSPRGEAIAVAFKIYCREYWRATNGSADPDASRLSSFPDRHSIMLLMRITSEDFDFFWENFTEKLCQAQRMEAKLCGCRSC